MRFQNFHLMILFRQKAVRKWVCLCVKHCRVIILCVLRWEKIYRQFLTKAIDHLYQRDNTDSHKAFWENYSTLTLILQCFVFVVVIHIYFLYILQLWIQPTHLHWNSTIKAHWDLYESTERAWFVSYSLCPFVPCSGKRWEGAEMIEELDLVLSFCACVCARVCVDREDWIWHDNPTQRPLTHTDL